MNKSIYEQSVEHLISSGTISPDSFVSDADSIINILDSIYDLVYDEKEDILYYIDNEGVKIHENYNARTSRKKRCSCRNRSNRYENRLRRHG